MRNNIQHIYYFVSKKQKKYIAKVFKNYLLYKFEKKRIIFDEVFKKNLLQKCIGQ